MSDVSTTPASDPFFGLPAPTPPAPAPAPFDSAPFAYAATAALDENQRWSTWSSVARGQHGPQPRPAWVVTDDAAVDTDLGMLKTGKEADVFVLERAVPGDPTRSSLLAAKRYRSLEHRSFHRSAAYTEGRRTRRTRDARAIAKGSAYGREAASGQWAAAEFETLSTLWSAGAAVPYPVQVDGTELLMELITVDGSAAPRLAQARADRATLAGWYDQVRDFIAQLARHGWAHGDLSAYNILAVAERVVVIDLPQVVDLVANPQGVEFLARDCHNVCTWFNSRGLDVDEGELMADAVAQAFG